MRYKEMPTSTKDKIMIRNFLLSCFPFTHLIILTMKNMIRILIITNETNVPTQPSSSIMFIALSISFNNMNHETKLSNLAKCARFDNLSDQLNPEKKGQEQGSAGELAWKVLLVFRWQVTHYKLF